MSEFNNKKIKKFQFKYKNIKKENRIMKIIEKINTIRNAFQTGSWWKFGNPYEILDDIAKDVTELEKENSALKAKLEVYESIRKDTKNNDKK